MNIFGKNNVARIPSPGFDEEHGLSPVPSNLTPGQAESPFAQADRQHREVLAQRDDALRQLDKALAENLRLRQQVADLNGECEARCREVAEYQTQNRALIASNREESTIAERLLAKADSAKALAYHLGNILEDLVKTSLKEGEAAKNEPRLPLDEQDPLPAFLSAPKAAE